MKTNQKRMTSTCVIDDVPDMVWLQQLVTKVTQMGHSIKVVRWDEDSGWIIRTSASKKDMQEAINRQNNGYVMTLDDGW